MCQNYAVENVCNWMVRADSPDAFCAACALNRTIPDLQDPANRSLWAKMEVAKRRLVYTLMRLGLPLLPKSVDQPQGLAFDFLGNPAPDFGEGKRIKTGHQDGIITINLAEADDAVREKMRLDLREVYRTLLGHFRHESGHYFWYLVVRSHPDIGRFRKFFGDEREDYGKALKRYYRQGPPPGWEDNFVTSYASAHPWEDWAETWAHYLHIMDTVETAAAQGVELRVHGEDRVRRLHNPFGRNFSDILRDWHALRIVLNSLNRSMGLVDAYPFVISAAVAGKLGFIHEWIPSTKAC